jgi:hypothetical protein
MQPQPSERQRFSTSFSLIPYRPQRGPNISLIGVNLAATTKGMPNTSLGGKSKNLDSPRRKHDRNRSCYCRQRPGLTIARELEMRGLVVESGQLREEPRFTNLNIVESVGERQGAAQVRKRI